MNSEANPIGNLTAKLLACLAILICLAVGAVGLVLPIIPGLLFLAIAAIIVARHSASFDRWLRRSPAFAGYLDSADRIHGLTFMAKVQYGSLLCLKMLIDGVAFVIAGVARLMSFSAAKYRQYR
jgi:uncharacterized membrane protein YbaN (DUF454 family)